MEARVSKCWMITEPPLFCLSGKFGDVILFLPALKAIHDRTGLKPRVLIADQYASVFDGVSYVEPIPCGNDWMDVHGIMAKAKRECGTPIIPAWWNDLSHIPEQTPGGTILRVHGHNWAVDQSKYPGFMQSMYLRAGFTLDEMMELPLIFDRRDLIREDALLKIVQRNKKPMLLLNFTGEASPFALVPEVMQALSPLQNKINFVRLDTFRAHRIYDLLGLMDKAIGTITVDTSTLHLAHGSKKPYIAFTRDGWSGSAPRGNCVANIKYSVAAQRASELPAIIEQWMAGTSTQVVTNGKPYTSAKCWFLKRRKVNLKNVTLWGCCWSQDRLMYEQTIRVLRYCSKLFDFQRIYFLSYMPVGNDLDFDSVHIPQLDMNGWNTFVNKTVPLIVKGDYVMSVHEDGFPIRPDLWTNRFLDYDYIGAPWNDGVVGNGGFNIESRKLMDEKLKLPHVTTPVHPSDNFVCRVHRKELETRGIKFAPVDVAVEFSTEMTGAKWPSFGFHGRTWQPTKHQRGWELISQIEREDHIDVHLPA